MQIGICWDIANGKGVIARVDPFVGDKEGFSLPKEILDHLEWIEMKTLDKLKRPNWSVFKGGY